MESRPAYARERSGASYLHELHAGNVGDVWKHAVLFAVLEAADSLSPRFFVECNAGAGLYTLRPTGEWREGAGRLSDPGATAGSAFKRFVGFLRGAGFEPGVRYPGSPLLVASAMRREDRLVCFETAPAAARDLAAALAGRDAVEIREEDGYAGLVRELSAAPAGSLAIAHVDPPWSQKADWLRMPELLARAAEARPGAILLLWYPIKSYTRVSAMHRDLSARGLAFHVADLITTPLEEKRNRLNGSGVAIFGAPESALRTICELASDLARLLRVRERYWSFRMESR